MAHFAEFKAMTDHTGFTSDSHQIVQRVVVVGNDIPANGSTLGENDMHVDGENWCTNFFKGGIWKQTSYNNNFRTRFACVGGYYKSGNDKFTEVQPYASWTLDSNDEWQAPIAYPTTTTYGDNVEYLIKWDEENQRWLGYDQQPNEFVYDPSSDSWSATGN